MLAYACFLATGCSSLVFEVSWNGLLRLTFGSATEATTAVLVAFLGGLGLGAFLIGRRLERISAALRVYGGLELALGAYSFAVPWLLTAAVPAILRALWPHIGGSGVLLTSTRFCLAVAFLGLPTLLMGATLPTLSRALVRSLGAVTAEVGRLYALNTVGAVIGVLAAAFVLLPRLGILPANHLAASVDVLVGLLVLLMGRERTAPTGQREPTSESAIELHGRRRLVFACLAVGGAAASLLEIAWYRALELVIGPTADAFSLMLVTFLSGLALGGWALSRYGDRASDRMRLLSRLYFGAAAAVFVSVALYPRLFPLFLWLFSIAGGAQGGVTPAVVVPPALAILPGTLFLGAVFPLAARLAAVSVSGIGGDVGRTYLWNTAGNIIGAALGGYALLPLLGIRGAMLVAMALLAICAAAARAASPRTERRTAGMVLAAVAAGALPLLAPSWDPVLMHLGVPVYAQRLLDENGRYDAARLETTVSAQRKQLRHHRDGRSTSVAVFDEDRGAKHNVYLRVGGKSDGSTVQDMPTQLGLGFLPVAYAPEARRALVIGWGTGVTVAALLELSNIEKVTVVEIEPAVIQAASYFSDANLDLLRDPRFRDRLEIVIDDGRARLAVDPTRYDIIVSEPSNPWLAGVANLFTEEFFALIRSRLNPGGVFVCWLQTYNLRFADLASAWRGLFAHFPQAYAFHINSDLITVGLLEDRALPVSELARLWSEPGHRSWLARNECPDFDWLMAQYLGDKNELLQRIGPGPTVHDLRNTLGYNAARALYADTTAENVERLHRGFRGALPLVDDQKLDPLGRSGALARLAHWAAVPQRRDVFLSEAMASKQVAPAAYLEACRQLDMKPELAERGGEWCRAAFLSAPDSPEARWMYGKWVARSSCDQGIEILEPITDDPERGGDARNVRAACRLQRPDSANQGFSELMEVAQSAQRWPNAAGAADALVVQILAGQSRDALRAWVERHPFKRGAETEIIIRRTLAEAR
jgi:spermidine synthase